MSGQLRREELAVEDIVRGLAAVQQPLRALGGRGGGVSHAPRLQVAQRGRAEQRRGVEADMLLLAVIERYLGIINLNVGIERQYLINIHAATPQFDDGLLFVWVHISFNASISFQYTAC